MLTAVLLIGVLFVGLLAMRDTLGIRVCALCGAVSGTWIVLLGLYHSGAYANETVIALLIGQSIVGGLYAVRARVPDRYHVYLLPSLLTATVLGYTLVVLELLVYAMGVITITWVLGVLLYTTRERERVETLFEVLVACCRDW